MNEKTRICVRLEGTYDQQVVKDHFVKHRDEYEIFVISPRAGTHMGLRIVMQEIHDAELPYDEIWAGFVLPEHDIYFDLNAYNKLKDLK